MKNTTTEDVSVPAKSISRWSTREILVAVVIAVIFGLLAIPEMYFGFFLFATAGVLISQTISGIYRVPTLIVPYIIRRRGAALLTGFVMGIVSLPFSPFGWITLIGQIGFGILCELPFLATRYRTYRLPILMFTGAFAQLSNAAIYYIPFGYQRLQPIVQFALIAILAVSGALGGLLAKLLADALARTGVLNGFALGREQSKELEEL